MFTPPKESLLVSRGAACYAFWFSEAEPNACPSGEGYEMMSSFLIFSPLSLSPSLPLPFCGHWVLKICGRLIQARGLDFSAQEKWPEPQETIRLSRTPSGMICSIRPLADPCTSARNQPNKGPQGRPPPPVGYQLSRGRARGLGVDLFFQLLCSCRAVQRCRQQQQPCPAEPSPAPIPTTSLQYSLSEFSARYLVQNAQPTVSLWTYQESRGKNSSTHAVNAVPSQMMPPKA
ncbi:hypothetical protein GQ53DRAFT_325043 [Thozetella sp. PMI_491]|nr:hypothetical protein GQ53DRAFT_325043 [Thozetella sp. PMI_491]